MCTSIFVYKLSVTTWDCCHNCPPGNLLATTKGLQERNRKNYGHAASLRGSKCDVPQGMSVTRRLVRFEGDHT